MSQASIMYQRHQACNNGTSKTETILRGQIPLGHGSVLLHNVETENEGKEGDWNNILTIFPCYRGQWPQDFPLLLPGFLPSTFARSSPPLLPCFYFIHIVWIRKITEGLSAESRVCGELEGVAPFVSCLTRTALLLPILYILVTILYNWAKYLKKSLSFACKTQGYTCKAAMPHERTEMIVSTKLNMSCFVIWDEKSPTLFGGVCRVIISDWQHMTRCEPPSELQPLWYKGDVKTNWWEFETEHSFPLSSLHASPPPNIWRGWKSCYIRSLLNIELVNGLYWFIYASLTRCWQ